MRVVFFFFQAEDGIRDGTVTGVQTCALPIYAEIDPIYSNGGESQQLHQVPRMEPLGTEPSAVVNTTDTNPNNRSEERRVGKECRARWSPCQEKKKNARIGYETVTLQ